MILKLCNGQINILDNTMPESIDAAHIKYNFEYGTNHLTPVLFVKDYTYEGDNITIPFNFEDNQLTLKVKLIDDVGITIKEYSGTFTLYKTFTLDTQARINIYDAYLKALQKIKDLEEKGDVI